MKTPDSVSLPDKNPRPEVSKAALKILKTILEGKIQSNFLRKTEPKLMEEFKHSLQELDECSTFAQLEITARANGTEITQEEINFAIESAKKSQK